MSTVGAVHRSVNFAGNDNAPSQLPSVEEIIAMKAPPEEADLPETIPAGVYKVVCSPPAPEQEQTPASADGRVIHTHAGVTYEGQLVNGYMHGKASIQFPDLTCFDGFVQKNSLTGLAVVSYDSMRYHGELVNGHHHGRGVLEVLGGGAIYKGDFQDGKRHGQGTLTTAGDSPHVYTGSWVADQKHGWGSMEYPSGSVYEGEWRHDIKDGFGTMYWTQRQERYRGFWKDNAPCGVGEHVWYRGATQTAGTKAAVLRCNRYVGLMHSGKRNGEGTMLYSTGSRYEGEWKDDCKHGDGVFVFENGSTWIGRWEKDQPVTEAGQPEFKPSGNHPCLNIQDILHNERDAAAVYKGAANVLMCYNSDLRSLHDMYASSPQPAWYHDGTYSQKEELRPASGLLSLHVWQMLVDAQLVCPELPLARVNEALAKACAPPAIVAARRQRVAKTSMAPGVWTFNVPLHSPFRVCPQSELCRLRTSLGKELTYPEFCEALVRVAQMRFSCMRDLEARLRHLVTRHLLPLLQPERAAHAITAFMAGRDFGQALAPMDAVLRITFAASCQIPVPRAGCDKAPTRPSSPASAPPGPSGQCSTGGLFVTPDLSNIGVKVGAHPDDQKTHPLDIVPKESCDSRTLTARQLIILLQKAGVVAVPDGSRPARGVSPQVALEALRLSCYPARFTPAEAEAGAESNDATILPPLQGTATLTQDAFFASTPLTYFEFVMACAGIAQVVITKDQPAVSKFRALVDGPRGLMAEALHCTGTALPHDLLESFSYLVQHGSGKGNKGSRRSRRGSVASKAGSCSAGGSLNGEMADLDGLEGGTAAPEEGAEHDDVHD